MRLTRYMKENLYNIIKNQTKNPITGIENECTAKLQEWVFKHCEPCVKEFYDLYGLYERHSICFYKHQYKNLTVIVPCYKWFTSIHNPKAIATNNYKSDRWEEVEKAHPDLAEICDKYQEGIALEQEYLEHLKNVREIIFNCNTDKQLSEVFPEFVQFFNKAGIIHKTTPNLPAKLGLTEALCKYGLKLEPKEVAN